MARDNDPTIEKNNNKLSYNIMSHEHDIHFIHSFFKWRKNLKRVREITIALGQK